MILLFLIKDRLFDLLNLMGLNIMDVFLDGLQKNAINI
jgi:hypothetical protein